jgi:hypothetical protein
MLWRHDLVNFQKKSFFLCKKLWIVRIWVQFFSTSYLYGHFDSLSSLLDDHSSHKPCVGSKNQSQRALDTPKICFIFLLFPLYILNFNLYSPPLSVKYLKHTSCVLINFIIYFFLWLTTMQLSTSKLRQTQILLAKTSFKFVYYFITSSLAIYLDGLIQD